MHNACCWIIDSYDLVMSITLTSHEIEDYRKLLKPQNGGEEFCQKRDSELIKTRKFASQNPAARRKVEILTLHNLWAILSC